MNLFETADEFANPKTLPQDDLDFLDRKEKSIVYQLKHIRTMVHDLENHIVGNKRTPSWNVMYPEDPEQTTNIQDIISSGFIPVTVKEKFRRYGSDVENERDVIRMFLPDIPQNRELAPKLQRVWQREATLVDMQRDIPMLRKRAKGRLSAWQRKQPTYVGRATGKELLKNILEKVNQHIAEMKWPFAINNAYYWAKNKMIVIDLPIREGLDHKSAIETAKTVVKPDLVKFIEELGYTQFRVNDRYYPDTRLTVVKIQIDDVEAKEKAAGHETT